MSIELCQKLIGTAAVEIWHILGYYRMIIFFILIFHRHSGGDGHLKRIDIFPVFPNPVIEMRPRAFSGITYVSDDLSLGDTAAFRNPFAEIFEMTVAGNDVVGMSDFDIISETSLGAFEKHVSLAGGDDRCADGRRVVDPEMGPVNFIDGMKSIVREFR